MQWTYGCVSVVGLCGAVAFNFTHHWGALVVLAISVALILEMSNREGNY